MTMRGVIQYRNPPSEIVRKMRTKLLKEANAGTIDYWHDEYVPGHFKESARKKYNYKPRSGELESEFRQSRFSIPSEHQRRFRTKNQKYYWRKRRQKGHGRPLVWSGTSRRIATRQIRVTSTSKRGTGTFTGLPRYFYMQKQAGVEIQRRPDGSIKRWTTVRRTAPDKADELTRTTRKEVLDMARFHERLITGKINQLNIHRTVKAG